MGELDAYDKEWLGKIELAKTEANRVLAEQEVKEYRARLAILAAEMQDKSNSIQ